MGWLGGWNYRKPITLKGETGAGKNYQVKLSIGACSGGDLHLQAHSEAFPADIRFTGRDGITKLGYFIEDETADLITVWVNVADSLEKNVDIYVYYGKAGATTESNFDDTFIAGDLFDSETLNTTRWPTVDGNPVYTIDPDNHYLEITNMDGNNYLNGKGFHSKTISLPSEWIIEDAYSSDGYGMYHHSTLNFDIFGHILSLHHTDWSKDDFGIGFGLVYDDWVEDKDTISNAGVGGNIYYVTGAAQPPVTTLYLIWKLLGNIHISLDGVERVDEANSEIPDRIHLGISRYSTYSFGTKRFYAFKVRKYAATEPAFLSERAEQQRCP